MTGHGADVPRTVWYASDRACEHAERILQLDGYTVKRACPGQAAR